MPKYNHMFDVAFSVESDNEADKVTLTELCAGLERRLAYLRTLGADALEAFGHCDTYETEYPQ